MREFSGNKEFEALKSTVTNAYAKAFPVEKAGHKLELKNIWVDDADLHTDDFTSQKKIKLAGGTWGAPVYATVVLKDATGKVIDEMAKIRLATIPKLTPRSSYIVNGNEYQVANQMIRKPGAYVIRSQRGDSFKGSVFLSGDSTQNLDIQFDPTTNKYTAKMGQANIPLYPLLKSLGVSDQHMAKTWGEEVYNANRTAKDSDYFKLAEKLTRQKFDNKQTAMEAIQAYAKGAKVDPEITKLTLGQAYDHLQPGMLIDTSTKLLKVYQGKAQADDPENLLFKEIRSVEDMLHDRLTSKKEQEGLKKMLGRQLGKRNTIKQLIDFRKLTSPVESFFIKDNRTSTPEQYNPVHMLSERNKITIHGTGGIQSEHAISDSLREVHPSHLGFIDPLATPESEKTGTILHLAAGVLKDGRTIRTQLLNIKSGKTEGLTPKEVFFKRVAFPDEYKDGKFVNPKEVRTQYQGKIEVVPSTQVEYVLPASQRLFSYATNLIPFLKNNQGTRTMMASKHLGQAIPLVEREAPHVQTELIPGITLHKAIGEEFVIKAPISGMVKAVTADYIQIGDKRIPIYNNFPLNQKTSIHHQPLVKPGDTVKAGQLIADSTYTKNGVLALGKNLNVAYLPYPGETFEDGIVITESAAKKLAAEQTYRSTFELEEGKHELNLRKYVSNVPNVFNKDTIKSYDDHGVIKKGMQVLPGQVLIAGLRDMRNAPENASLARINKGLRTPFGDASVKYAGEFPGVVTDVVKRGNKVDVYVKSVEPAREADKLSGVHGNKGVISKVIPDNEAPRTKDGKIPDVFMNPHGIIGRINLGQLFESAASKIAQKTGKPYVVKNFDDHKTIDKVNAELKEHGLSDTEEMFLPDGRPLGKVNMGSPYILRLAKTGKTGFAARMPGQGYDANLQPTKGGEEGTKQLDLLTIYSMLSHGAKKNLIDAHQKSERNDEYWHALETGKPLPSPKNTFAYQKFVGLLKGAGINVDKKGTDVTLAPMTDKDVLALSKGKINEPEFLHAKNLKEIKGGFFDTTTTGGLNGTRYTHLALPGRIPNPVFESAIKSITGLKQQQYMDLVAGKLHVDSTGKLVTTSSKGTVTGGEAIAKLLDSVNPEAMIPKLRSQIKLAKDDNDIDNLNRKIRYLTALKDLNLKPSEAYTRTVVPVVPPVYRPIQEVQGRGLQVAPVNHLYQNLGLLSKAHEFPVMKLLGDADKSELHQETYKATRALAGLEDVTTRGKDQPIKGFISQITDTSPKKGFFLNKLVTKRQDLVGRGVIVNGPDLHVDELGIPEKMAWTIFRPFIVRELVRSGYKPEQARKEIETKTGVAKKALESVMKQRTVMLNRAPSLHKFSIMAFKPKLTDGLAIEVPSLAFKGLGADVDGDAVSIHVPSSEEAVRESLHMMPSRNLFKPGTGELMLVPSQEAAIGVYFLSQTKEGREKINALLPPQYHVTALLDAKAAKALFEKIAKELPTKFADIVSNLKKLGDTHAYESGFTASLKDVKVDTKIRDVIFKKADEAAAKIRASTKPGDERDAKISEVYIIAAKEAFQKGAKQQLAAQGSNFYHMVNSGARGKDSQLQQIVSAPGIVMDSKDKPVPVPIKKSYAEGISTSDYFVSSYGVRKGITDRSLQTSKPGALNKDIMASTADNVITSHDCGTHKGINLPVSSKDCLDRLLSSDQQGFKRNDPVTPAMISELIKRRAGTVTVRSPLTCIAEKGTCAACFGHDEFGKLPDIGDNVGIKMGQTMSEPMTQLTMRTFHSGGVAGAGPQASGFQRISQILNMPKYVAGEAALAKTSGKVTKIDKTAAGGFNIWVGNENHIVRPGVNPKVKVGDTVTKGDALSQGVIKPQSLLALKGMRAAQEYVVDELQRTYQDQGIPIHRKVFETVVRSVANNTRIVEAPKHGEWLPGDVIPFTAAEHYNETRKQKLPATDAVGYHLRTAIGKLPQNHEVKDSDVPYLRAMGYNEVEVVKDPVKHSPLLKGIAQLPMLKKDWMAQFGYRYIEKGLTEGAAQNWKSNVEGLHPIPAFAYGANFGKKKEHY